MLAQSAKSAAALSGTAGRKASPGQKPTPDQQMDAIMQQLDATLDVAKALRRAMPMSLASAKLASAKLASTKPGMVGLGLKGSRTSPAPELLLTN